MKQDKNNLFFSLAKTWLSMLWDGEGKLSPAVTQQFLEKNDLKKQRLR